MGLPEIKKAENFAGVQGPQAPVGCRGNAPAGGFGGFAPQPLKTFYYLNINWKPLLAAFFQFREKIELSKMLQGEG